MSKEELIKALERLDELYQRQSKTHQNDLKMLATPFPRA
jgi:hypothetical protein